MDNLVRLIIVGGLLTFAVPMLALGMVRNDTDLLGPVHLLLFVIAVAVYLVPTALAFYRNCIAAVWIAVVNVFLGWTIFGWFVSIGWAASGKVRTLPPTIATRPPYTQHSAALDYRAHHPPGRTADTRTTIDKKQRCGHREERAIDTRAARL